MDWMPQAVRDGVIVVLVISGPLVLAAAAIGLAIGILQAATQIQEQTIGSALKIIGVFALIIILGFWMFQYLTQYTNKTLTAAFTFIPRQTQKVVPRTTPDELILKRDGTSTSFPQIPKLKSEPLELKTPQGAPPGAQLLGSPHKPPPTPIIQAQPADTPVLPQPPPIAKPKLPLSDFQEPVAIPQQQLEMLQNEELLNFIPNNKHNKDAINIDLWNRKEVVTEIGNYKRNSKKNNISWVE